MDNFRIDITSEGDIAPALALALKSRPVTHYAVRSATADKPERIILFWASSSPNDKDAVKLPFKMGVEDAARFVTGWLSECNYGREPDHDGDNGKGWRLYNEAWGHVDGSWSAIVAVAPVWAMYGK